MKTIRGKIGKSAAVLVGLLLALSLCAGGIFAYADEVSGKILGGAATGGYRYFDDPTALFADGNGFIVADGGTAYSFNNDGKQTGEIGISDGVQKLYRTTDGKLFALADGILTLGGEQLTDKTDYVDFALAGEKIFAVDGKTDGNIYLIGFSEGEEKEQSGTSDTEGENEAAEQNPGNAEAIYSYGSPISMIAAYGDRVYLGVPQRYMTRIVPCAFDAEENSLTVTSGADTETGEVRQIYGVGKGVVLLGRNEIAAYDFTLPAKWSKAKAHSAYDTVAIFPHGETVYAIDQLGGVYRLSEDYSERTLLLAAASDAPGYYHGLRGIATGQNMLAVADMYNDRVQILGGAQTRQISGIMRPKAVAVDSFGNIFVAHNGCEIEVYDSSTLTEKHELSPLPGNPAVVKLATDSDDVLYVLCDNGQLYKVSDTSKSEVTYEAVGNGNVSAFAIAPDNSLYTMTQGGDLLKTDRDGKTEKALTAQIKAVDFCVDHDAAIYMLAGDGKIYRSEKPYTAFTTYDISGVEGGHEILAAGNIVMNTVISEDIGLQYGDLIVTDTAAEALIVFGKDKLKVNKGFEVSDKAPDVPEYSPEMSIYTLTSSCEVYYQAAQISTGVRLGKGTRIIVPRFDKNENFTFVIADNPGANEPIRGYIDTKYLSSAPLEYGDAPADKYRVILSQATVYDYPTVNLPADRIHTLPRDSYLYLEPFVYTAGNYGYIDNYSGTEVNLWYRVRYTLDGEQREGFIKSDSVTERGERTVYPKYNAKIIAKNKGDKYAQLYRMNEDGNMVEETLFLPPEVGKRVEVIGRFDSSAKYTKIRCDIEGMVLTFYVETANLQYEGVDTVVIVAVVIAILTLILGAVLIWYFLKNKHTKKYEKK